MVLHLMVGYANYCLTLSSLSRTFIHLFISGFTVYQHKSLQATCAAALELPKLNYEQELN